MQDNDANKRADFTERPTPLWPLGPFQRARLSRSARVAIALSLVFSLVALVLSAALVFSLWRVGRSTGLVLDGALAQLDEVCGPNARPLTYTFSQTIRFKGDIGMPEGMVMPFKGVFPINTVVRLTVPGFPGSPEIEVPINTTIPVDTQVPIPGGLTIPVDTEIPVRQEIPIDICGEGGDVSGFLKQAAGSLRVLRGQLPGR